MTLPSSRHLSPWVDTMPALALEPVALDALDPDVLVVGGGITGMTTALLLQQAGRRAVVVEGARLAESVTTHSTVKVTVGQGTVYSAIEEAVGSAAAAAYAEANVAGFAQLMDLVSGLGIDCMLERGLDHVVYAEDADGAEQLEREANLTRRLGLPATVTDRAPLPFEVTAALRFDGQAQFHPAQYLAGLAEAFVADGGVVLEGVRAQGVDERPDACHVETTEGQVSAPHVVVATQYPILDRGAHFTRLRAQRSYGVAGVLPDGVPAGMTINTGSPTHSTRTVRMHGDELLVVVGEGHEVGHVSDTGQRWVRLQEWARERFGVEDFRYHWSAEETSSLDHVPFAGFIAPGSERVVMATAYAGWGMTNGTACAMLLRDLILGRENPWAATFDARRAETRLPGKGFVSHNVHVAKTWLKDRVVGAPVGSPDELAAGDAAVLDVGGEQTAFYRDEDGTLHGVSAVCTHMACNVEWNDGERSWDCPCHGSRFDVDGAVLHGPAVTPLRER